MHRNPREHAVRKVLKRVQRIALFDYEAEAQASWEATSVMVHLFTPLAPPVDLRLPTTVDAVTDGLTCE